MNTPASFSKDHTKMQAPFIKDSVLKVFDSGLEIRKSDIRFCTPNSDYRLGQDTMHSMEHILSTILYSHYGDLSSGALILDLSPMGCGTGFYCTYLAEKDFEVDYKGAILMASRYTTVPGSAKEQCGAYLHHNVGLAQQAFKRFFKEMWG